MERFFSKIRKATTSAMASASASAGASGSAYAFASTSAFAWASTPAFASTNVVLTSPSLPPHLDIPSDPGLRKNICNYDVKDKENVKRSYLQKGPCQPKNHNFPLTAFGIQKRRFNPKWFEQYSDWLKYSISKDAAFCLCCYLFKSGLGDKGGSDSFIGEGFKNWKKKERFDVRVGEYGSNHRKCVSACQDLMNQPQHIEVSFSNQSEQIRFDYRIRLTASINCIRFLLRQGLAFRGHDESEGSQNQRNFLELLRFLAEHNEDINRVVLKNAPENLKLTSPTIQREIINSISVEITNSIINEVGDEPFSLLVDEAPDISIKEQMAVVLCFVDDRGFAIERFIGLVHVTSTTALSLKEAIDDLFSKYGLSLSSLQGQSYNGASNMQGEFNGLKTLIMMENESTYYIHCFAHQLQLTLVAVAENHSKIDAFFDIVASLSNVVGGSCKRRDILREKQFQNVVQGICDGSVLTGRGLNQETSLKRAGETRWGSHYYSLMSLVGMFSSVVDVLLIIGEDENLKKQRTQADTLLEHMQCFEFLFILHLMRNILGITNDLSQALQKKDQDIVNAMTLVGITKAKLQRMREEGWESLIHQVSLFCVKHTIKIPNIEDIFVVQGRSRRNSEEYTNRHYYRVELFYAMIDLQLQELNNRFNEVNTVLLICMASLDPTNSFFAFYKVKLLRFAEFYPSDFKMYELMALEHQLNNCIMDMRSDHRFSDVVGVSGLAKKLVQVKKHRTYSLVYLLLKLALFLPVATATVESVFSAMKIIKSQLRNRLGYELMNDSLVAYIENDVFKNIENEEVIQCFQNMKARRGIL